MRPPAGSALRSRIGSFRWHEHEFIDEVAASNRATLTHRRGSTTWQLDVPDGPVPWTCVLSSAHNETDATVEWRTTAVGAGHPPIELGLGYGSDGTSGGVLSGSGLAATTAIAAVSGVVSWLRRRSAPPATREGSVPPERASKLGAGWWVHDPSGVIDDGLAALLLAAPLAWRGPGRETPAFIERCSLNPGHLVVGSSRWWTSAPALQHHIDVGLALAAKLRTLAG